MRSRRSTPLAVALFVAAPLIVSLVVAGPAAATGPGITITNPAPGTTVSVGSRFRVGWKETPASYAPIISRVVAGYSGARPTSGDCSKATYALAWSNSSANRPFRYPITGIAAGRCWYWVVKLTDINGASVSAKTGFVGRPPATDPGLDVVFPVPGSFTDAPVATYTIAWTETSTKGIASRTVTEESAPMATGRTCVGVTWAATGRTFAPTAASVSVSSLASNTCYRYKIAVSDAADPPVTATAVSGPLLITGTPPPCAYGDVGTTYTGDANWQRSLVETTYPLSSTYAPGDLVYTSGIPYVSGSYRVRNIAYADLKALAAAARSAGAAINIVSAYRSYSTQVTTFNSWVSKNGMYSALLGSARAGHSEHQLGTAVDFKTYGGSDPWLYSDWGTTKAGYWMAQNAYKYGWVMSYPKSGSPATSCYQYEPWHFRYVGRTLAAAIHSSGLVPRTYLWRAKDLAPGA